MTRMRAPLALLGVAAAATVTGCASTIDLEPAPEANDPGRANLTVRLPDEVSGQSRRWTNAQSTGAWGDPARIFLTCGVPVPGPPELPCYEFGGVDWLALEADEDIHAAITYGRTPAVLVTMTREGGLDFATVLEDLATVVFVATPTPTERCT